MAGDQRFFHWELEFPEVFRRGGFDAIVGNPPWETVKPNSKEFWSNYDPFFRDLGKQDALRRMAELRQDPEADRAWRLYSLTIEQTSRWLRASGLYLHQGRGDLNTYKLFLERAYGLLRRGGTLSFVVPSGLYTDQGATELRTLFFERGAVRSLVSLENRKGIFPIHRSFKVVLFSVERGGASPAVPCAFFIGRDAQGRDLAPDLPALRAILSDVEEHLLPLPLEAVRRFSPDTLSLMEFKNRREMEIAAKIYDNHPLLGEEVPGAWNVRFTTEFHMTNDSRLFRDRGWLLAHGCREVELTSPTPPTFGAPLSLSDVGEGEGGRGGEGEVRRPTMWIGPGGERYLPLYEGKSIHQYNAFHEEPRFWVNEAEARKALGLLPATKGDYQRYRLAYRLIARSTDEITLISTVSPRDVFAGHSLAVVVSQDETLANPVGQLVASAIMNSFSLNAVLRQKVSANITMFYAYQLPFPRLTVGHPHFDALVVRAARLTCTTPEFADLWNGVARHYPQEMPAPWRPVLPPPGGGGPGRGSTDPGERARLRAEIDALVADLYGLSEEDFAYILTTFPLLDRDQLPLEGEPKSFITRDQALLALFQLRQRRPPQDIVAFFARAGADIAPVTGPLRDLEERVRRAWELGAVAYIPSRRGGTVEEE